MEEEELEELIKFVQTQLEAGTPVWAIAENLRNARFLSKQEAEQLVNQIAEQTRHEVPEEVKPPQTQSTIYHDKSLFREIIEIAVSSVVLAVGFGIVFAGGISAFSKPELLLKMILISLGVVSSSFILHEMGHRYVARKYEFSASYVMWLPGLVLALVVSLSGFIFAAPGAVMIRSKEDTTVITTKQIGHISIAGPLVNLVLSIIFMLFMWIFISGDDFTAASNMPFLVSMMGAEINAMLAGLNLLPVLVFDGRKVFRWNKLIWLLVFFVSVGLFSMIRTAPSWVDSLASLGEPKVPVSYTQYKDDISGISFQYPSNWVQSTYEEELVYFSKQEPDIQIDYAIGAYSMVYFKDPTSSGILVIRNFDYSKKDKSITEIDTSALSEMIDGIISDLDDGSLVTKRKTIIGEMTTDSNAWEANFIQDFEGSNLNCTYIVSSQGPVLNYTSFICDERYYDVLLPAYERFKETFEFN